MAQPIVVAFTGKRSSGKSEAVKVLVETLGFHELKFADPLKNMLRALYEFYDVSPSVIERKIEGDLKEEICDILPTISGEQFGAHMLRAMYKTCGVSRDEFRRTVMHVDGANAPCDWLMGKTPVHALKTLTEDWKELVAIDGATPRWAMQSLGTEWRDLINQDLWSNMFTKAVTSGNLGDRIACSDYRFPHEGVTLNNLGAVKYRVVRPTADAVNDKASQHISETAIDAVPTDMDIINDGTIEKLRNTVFEYVLTGMQVSGAMGEKRSGAMPGQGKTIEDCKAKFANGSFTGRAKSDVPNRVAAPEYVEVYPK